MTDEPKLKDVVDEMRAKVDPAQDPVRTARESAWKVRCAADIARALTMREGSHHYTPQEIADRASDISDHLWKQAASRGWTY